jgi:hypothetical protein
MITLIQKKLSSDKLFESKKINEITEEHTKLTNRINKYQNTDEATALMNNDGQNQDHSRNCN